MNWNLKSTEEKHEYIDISDGCLTVCHMTHLNQNYTKLAGCCEMYYNCNFLFV